MPSLKENLLTMAVVGSLALSLNACSSREGARAGGSSNPRPPVEVVIGPQIEFPDRWGDPILIEANNGKIVDIPILRRQQSPYIGLTRIYLINSNEFPVIAIRLVWNPQEVKTRAMGGRLSLTEGLGFQEIGDEPFVPNLERAAHALRKEEVPEDFTFQFARYSRAQINTVSLGTANVPWSTFTLLPRLPGEIALVLGEGLVEYRGEPSPQSTVRLRFAFGSPPSD